MITVDNGAALIYVLYTTYFAIYGNCAFND